MDTRNVSLEYHVEGSGICCANKVGEPRRILHGAIRSALLSHAEAWNARDVDNDSTERGQIDHSWDGGRGAGVYSDGI